MKEPMNAVDAADLAGHPHLDAPTTFHASRVIQPKVREHAPG
jgi:hypothetical protein